MLSGFLVELVLVWGHEKGRLIIMGVYIKEAVPSKSEIEDEYLGLDNGK